MIVVMIVLVGLLVGSFIGALTYRLPRGEGFVKGRSYCDNCGRQLLWLHNIPVFSYLFLRGKSACCGKKISIRYPLIEIASAVGAVFLFLIFPVLSLFIIHYSLFILCLMIFIIDLEHQIIPDELTWMVLCLGLYTKYDILYTSLFSGFFCAFLLLVIHLVTRGRGMGLGDVKLAIALGLWFSFVNSLYWLMTAFILGGIVASILLLLKRAKLKTKLAFGPFLILSFWLVLLTR